MSDILLVARDGLDQQRAKKQKSWDISDLSTSDVMNLTDKVMSLKWGESYARLCLSRKKFTMSCDVHMCIGVLLGWLSASGCYRNLILGSSTFSSLSRASRQASRRGLLFQLKGAQMCKGSQCQSSRYSMIRGHKYFSYQFQCSSS